MFCSKVPLSAYFLTDIRLLGAMQALRKSRVASKLLPLSHTYISARSANSYSTMKALVYKGIGSVELEERPRPKLQSPTDAIVKLSKTTICGTDLHIRGGDVATCAPGRILGHEGVGIVDEVGASVIASQEGEKVLISCISSCATCEYCRRGMYSHCTTGGWILGNTIDGTQAEYVRIPHANSSLYPIPTMANVDLLVMLSDIFPTGLECGVQNGNVRLGGSVAIIGAGPVGLAALITAQLFSPSVIIMIDQDMNRLETAKKLGAHYTIDPSNGQAEKYVKSVTDGKGCDTVIEAVGIPATFELCQKIVAPGGTIANVGVHGTKVELHLENLWSQNICMFYVPPIISYLLMKIAITTRLVDTVTTPMLLKMVLTGQIDPSNLITHST
jgi:alcohol dehydrogenase